MNIRGEIFKHFSIFESIQLNQNLSIYTSKFPLMECIERCGNGFQNCHIFIFTLSRNTCLGKRSIIMVTLKGRWGGGSLSAPSFPLSSNTGKASVL